MALSNLRVDSKETMAGKHDINSLNDIKALVDAFYTKVADDALLSPVFKERLGDSWLPHLQKMYTFWQTLLLQEHTYNGAPFPPHARCPLTKSILMNG